MATQYSAEGMLWSYTHYVGSTLQHQNNEMPIPPRAGVRDCRRPKLMQPTAPVQRGLGSGDGICDFADMLDVKIRLLHAESLANVFPLAPQ
jgi:hypothetical protein